MAKAPKRARRSPSTRARSKADPRDRIIDGFISLLAGQGFGSVGLVDIAEESDVTLAELRGLYASKSQILADFTSRIDQTVLSGDPAEGERARDRLFDIMMRRFDALSPHKQAMRRLARSARCDLGLAALLIRLQLRSQRWMFAAAGLRPRGLEGAIAVRGSALVLAEATRVWLTDDDPGQGPTMAALDRALSRGDRVMRFLGDCRRVCWRAANGKADGAEAA